MPGAGRLRGVRPLPCRGPEIRPRVDGARNECRHAKESALRDAELAALVRAHAVVEQALGLVGRRVRQPRDGQHEDECAGHARSATRRPDRLLIDRHDDLRRFAQRTVVERAGSREGGVIEPRQHRLGLEGDAVAHAGPPQRPRERLSIVARVRHALPQRIEVEPAQLARRNGRARVGDRAHPSHRAQPAGVEPATTYDASQRDRKRGEREQRPEERPGREGRRALGPQLDADRQTRGGHRIARGERRGADHEGDG